MNLPTNMNSPTDLLNASVYFELIALSRQNVNLDQLETWFYLMLNEPGWLPVQLDGIHQARYFVRKWKQQGYKIPPTKEFNLFNQMLRRWFLRKFKKQNKRNTSCDVIHLLLVSQRVEANLPSCILRYITQYFDAQKAPSFLLL